MRLKGPEDNFVDIGVSEVNRKRETQKRVPKSRQRSDKNEKGEASQTSRDGSLPN